VLKIEIQDLTIAYCKSKSKKTREVKRKLKKDLENKMRSCDEQLEENTFKKGISVSTLVFLQKIKKINEYICDISGFSSKFKCLGQLLKPTGSVAFALIPFPPRI
jgi:pyruvate formate-lyase activating enzyme-like uncharacterized protein